MSEKSFNEQARERLIEFDVATISCRDCGEEIWFIKNKIGKFVPIDLNFEIHKCPNKQRRDFKPRSFNNSNRGWDKRKDIDW